MTVRLPLASKVLKQRVCVCIYIYIYIYILGPSALALDAAGRAVALRHPGLAKRGLLSA